jgi:hypothetical protein
MGQRRLDHLLLALIALFMLPAAIQATFWPQSFFDDFPLGRGWISHGGDAYNEHLVRDVGGLFLAMIIASALTVWRRGDTRPLAVAWLVQGLLHLVFHLGHLDGFQRADQVGLVVSLVTVPALAAWALVEGRRS